MKNRTSAFAVILFGYRVPQKLLLRADEVIQ